MFYGIGTYLKQLTEGLLKNQGISIYIVSYHANELKEFTISTHNNRLTEIFIQSPRIISKKDKEGDKYAARIVDLLTETIKNANNVIFQVNYPNTLPLVKQLKAKFSCPVISVVHSAMWQFGFTGNKKRFIEVWQKHKSTSSAIIKPLKDEKELYALSDKIISVTNYMKEFIITYYNIPDEKISVIHNGIESSNFHILVADAKASIKEQLGFKVDEKIVLFSGRLDPSKGIYFLLDAFAEVVKLNDKARLVLIGEDSGPEKISQYLKHCINFWSRVTFTGFVNYDTAKKFYQITDVGIIPSIYDHCPYVVLEMVGFNVPVIISDTEGLNEILSNQQSVYLTPKINSEGDLAFDKIEIANAILLLLENEQHVKFISRDYSKLMKYKFSLQRMSYEMFNVLRSLAFTPIKSGPQ